MILSIIIPTKNRYYTLFSLVETLLSFDIPEMEILIQDNSDDNTEALNFIQKQSAHSNLKYFYESDRLSVIENSDRAVLNSTGDYICFIGDDDGVMSYIIQVVKWMKRNNVRALKAFKPDYYWPNQKSNFLSRDTSGNLRLKGFKYEVIKRSTKAGLIDTLKKGGTSLNLLPCLYHGIVERDVLNKIYELCATFFPGPSPDMSNAVALTQIIKDYVYVGFPVVISGKNTQSTGGQGVLHQHISRIEDVSHLPNKTSEEWSRKIPKYWTGPTIWAESVIKAVESCDNSDVLKDFNYDYLYATIDIFHGGFRDEIFNEFSYKKYNMNYYLSYFKILSNRVRFFINNRFDNRITKYNNVKDIGHAIELINKQVSQKTLSLILESAK